VAVRIRLQRKGAKKRPFYRIVVVDQRKRLSGQVLEVIGTYDPLMDPPKINLDRERAREWQGKGALPSEAVQQILKAVEPEETTTVDP